jgi:hypothetical protein
MDPGFSVILLHPSIANSHLKPTNRWPFGVTGDGLLVQGETVISFGISDCMIRHVFLVYKLQTNVHSLLGMDFLAQWRAELDISHKIFMLDKDKAEISENKRWRNSHSSSEMPDFRGLTTLRAPTPTRHENSLSDVHTSNVGQNVFTQEVPELDSDIVEIFSNSRVEQNNYLSSPNLWVVYSLESITIPAKSKKAVCEKLVGSNHGDVPTHFVSSFIHMLDQNKKGHKIFWKGAEVLQIELNTTYRK